MADRPHNNPIVAHSIGTFGGIMLAVLFIFVVLPMATCGGCLLLGAVGASVGAVENTVRENKRTEAKEQATEPILEQTPEQSSYQRCVDNTYTRTKFMCAPILDGFPHPYDSLSLHNRRWNGSDWVDAETYKCQPEDFVSLNPKGGFCNYGDNTKHKGMIWNGRNWNTTYP